MKMSVNVEFNQLNEGITKTLLSQQVWYFKWRAVSMNSIIKFLENVFYMFTVILSPDSLGSACF